MTEKLERDLCAWATLLHPSIHTCTPVYTPPLLFIPSFFIFDLMLIIVIAWFYRAI